MIQRGIALFVLERRKQMKRSLLCIAALVVVFLVNTPLFAQDKIQVSDISATKTHDADYMGYVGYELTAEVKNFSDMDQEVAVSIRGISNRGGGGTAYLYGRIPAKSGRFLSFDGRMLETDWQAIEDWEVVDVSVQ